MARGSEGWVVGSRFDGSVQISPTSAGFFRLSDKPGITIFVIGSAHKYNINVVFTPYLNWSKVTFLGFSLSLPHRSIYTNKSNNVVVKAKIASRGYDEKKTF